MTRTEKKRKIEHLASRLLRYTYVHRNGKPTRTTLSEAGWAFRWNKRSFETLGWARYDKRVVEVGIKHIDEIPYNELEDILRHEIAHAMVGPGYGHGDVWRRAARLVGAEPTRCSTVTDDPEIRRKINAKRKYKAFCTADGCNTVRYFNRLGKHWKNTIRAYNEWKDTGKSIGGYLCKEHRFPLKVVQQN